MLTHVLVFQDRLAVLPASRTPVSEFQHPYFPPPFTTPAMSLQNTAASASAEVFSPAVTTLQHLQTADPYQVTSSALHNFTTSNQVSLLLDTKTSNQHKNVPLLGWQYLIYVLKTS